MYVFSPVRTKNCDIRESSEAGWIQRILCRALQRRQKIPTQDGEAHGCFLSNDRKRWSKTSQESRLSPSMECYSVFQYTNLLFQSDNYHVSEAKRCLFLIILYAPCLAVSLGAHTSHHVFTCSASASSSGLAATTLPCPSRSLPALEKNAV
jgi:hypothetical protein